MKQSKPNNRCLLANDHDFLLTIFGYSLEKHFNHIVKAVDGDQAVKAVKNNPIDYFDLIILDVNMPICDGKEACTKILEHYQTLLANQNNSRTKRSSFANYTLSRQSFEPRQEKIFEEEEKANDNDDQPNRRKIPNIYALTSDLNQRLKAQLKLIGFKNVYQELNEP